MYRDLKRNDEDIQRLMPVDVEIKAEKQEQIMHNVMSDRNWKEKNIVNFSTGQTGLFDHEGES